MDKKRSSQPILNDDERESSTKDITSQISPSHKIPGSKTKSGDVKSIKGKGERKS